MSYKYTSNYFKILIIKNIFFDIKYEIEISNGKNKYWFTYKN